MIPARACPRAVENLPRELGGHKGSSYVTPLLCLSVLPAISLRIVGESLAHFRVQIAGSFMIVPWCANLPVHRRLRSVDVPMQQPSDEPANPMENTAQRGVR